jgi:putative transposase
VRETLEISERRACRTLNQARSTQRYEPLRPLRDAPVVERLHALSETHPEHGYRMMTGLLQMEGWKVNHKRVERLWRQHGLQGPRKAVKRCRLGTSENGSMRLRAAYPNHVWSYDFMMDATEDGARLKLMTVIDEYTRESLTIEVERRMTAKDVLTTIERLIAERGAPAYIRSDNGPEFIARALRVGLNNLGVETRYIEPGSPWQNAFVESFNGTLRSELLDRELFGNLHEARVVIETWRRYYNMRRPHSALGYQPPAIFANQHRTNQQPAPILT